MKKNLKKSILVMLILSVIGVLSIQAQTKREAIEAYNAGINLMKTNPAAALDSLNKSITISEALGEEGTETKDLAKSLIPGIYYQMGVDLYKDKKLEEAASKFTQTIEISEKFGDTQIKTKAEKIVPQLFFAIGNNSFKNNDDSLAIVYYDKATTIKPDYTKAYFGKALVYRKQENTEKMLAEIDKTIELAMNENDTETSKKAEETARDYLLIKAQKAIQEKSWDNAITLLKNLGNYDNKSKDAFYFLGIAYNAQSKWNDAIHALDKAVELETETGDALAKLHYEKGIAYAGMGNNSEACASYKLASKGSYKANADYQMEHVLKCK